MTRNVLDEAHIHPQIRKAIADSHSGIVGEVKAAVAAHDVVVVGMKQNPHPKKARKALDAAGIPYEYLSYGSYLGSWKRRTRSRCGLAGRRFRWCSSRACCWRCKRCQRLIDSGEIKALLAGKRGKNAGKK